MIELEFTMQNGDGGPQNDAMVAIHRIEWSII